MGVTRALSVVSGELERLEQIVKGGKKEKIATNESLGNYRIEKWQRSLVQTRKSLRSDPSFTRVNVTVVTVTDQQRRPGLGGRLGAGLVLDNYVAAALTPAVASVQLSALEYGHWKFLTLSSNKYYKTYK
ncbi:hypothetical protein Clacol_008736 [Clathrus columnatus]|uniref:Uncharacterized protein n=1 Tax=Clathrus columnatus TaxID=1419009 RepID=A0AAV5ALB9_9AGAM|nr:hypothetical protein Clacol_008736 [Clathrus columnatus]